MKDRIKLFLREYKAFKQYAATKGIAETVEEVIQLFAIYRKDIRAEEIRNDKEAKENLATPKQKRYLKTLIDRNGLDESKLAKPIDELTKEEASQLIDSLTA